MMKIEIIEGGRIPVRGSKGAACYDAHARIENGSVLFTTGATFKVPLGFKAVVPPGHALLVTGRSGNSLRGVQVIQGTVDPDYRGEVCAIVHAVSTAHGRRFGMAMDYCGSIEHGERIAQIRLVQVPELHMFEGVVTSNTERGDGGFGSTGK